MTAGILRALFAVVCSFVLGSVAAHPASAQVEMPTPNLSDRITIAADSATHWKEGAYDVWLLNGNCYINQGLAYARSHDAVLWIEPADPTSNSPAHVLAYLEGDVSIHYDDRADGDLVKPRAKVTDKTWFGRFQSIVEPEVRVPSAAAEPTVKPVIYKRARAHRDSQTAGTIHRTQFTQPSGSPGEIPTPVETLPQGTRRVRAFTRSDTPVQAQLFPDQSVPNGWIAVINSGVNLVVDGLNNFGALDVSADRVVVWTSGMQEPDLSGQTLQRTDQPLEIYMEGNIVFRQGDRTIRAQAMYYDVRLERGVVLDAEAMSPVPRFAGIIRVKADVLQEIDRNHFIARNALFTTSRMGEPTYWVRGDTMTYEDVQQPLVNPVTGTVAIDPATGAPLVDHQQSITANNDVVFIEGVPIFYWPVLATDLERPQFYVERVQIKNDNIFGFQVLTDWNMYQLLGIRRPPPGTEWSISLDELTKRGFGGGTLFKYDRPDFLGWGGPAKGSIDAWFLHDGGVDNLGQDRPAVPPEPDRDIRGRVVFQHRQQFADDLQLTGEVGYITDRNFLQEYYRKEWEWDKDESTDVELKQIKNNSSWSIFASARVDNFFMDTEWLPRLDHFWLGQPLVNDSLTWFEHTSLGFVKLRPATAPTFPTDAATFTLLPYEAQASGSAVQGDRLVTRQELDLPLQAGPVKVVPYVLGEVGHWGEDLEGDSLTRLYGQLGVRTSLPFWAANSQVEDDLFNLHGLAHKVTFDIDFSYADANQDVTEFPLYDQIDDNQIESFRRRLAFQTFGGPFPLPFIVPKQYDERIYALRTGMQDWVTAPVSEIADDLTTMRFDLRQRWQTKRGPPDDRHIIDWITLDTQLVWFPEANRDNFGEPFGLAEYDFTWNVGDRLTILSTGFMDFFSDAPKEFTVDAILTRPPRGTLSVGFRSLEGPMSSNVIHTSYAYRMSPKWVSTAALSYDLSSSGNIGQQLSVTRIGEAFLTTLGFTYDRSQNSFGVVFMVEPRFLPKTRLSRTSGLDIPLAGSAGLE